MTSRSKTHYQGQHIRRVQRSELEDNTMRDQARHHAKLEESLKTVDRAKNVMIKSMEADRQLFMKTGQGKAKMSKTQSSQPAQSRGSVSQPQSRLVSDSRVKRTSVTDDTDMTSPSARHISDRGEAAKNGGSESKSSRSSSGPDLQIPELDSGSIYDKFLADNTTRSSNQKSKGSTLKSDETDGSKPKHKTDASADTGKKASVWDTLSTPKNTTGPRSRREQELTATSGGSRTTTARKKAEGARQ